MSLERLLEFDIPLTKILDELDGLSAISLANTSLLVNGAVYKNLSGNRGNRYWAQRCEHWREDPVLLKVLASYDPIFPKMVNRDLQECRVEFDWGEAFLAAHDVGFTIRSCNWTLRSFKEFQDRIKTDIVVRYDDSSLSRDYPCRFTGTSGSLAWNILCPGTDKRNNPETVLVFEDMAVCRGAKVADHDRVLMSFVMLLPRVDDEEVRPLVKKVDRALVWRLLVSVGDTFVQISPMHEGESCRILLEQYVFIGHKHEMDPVVSHCKDIIAIWSSPYSLKVYKVWVEFSGNVNADVIAQVDVSEETKRIFMGRLWSRMAQAVNSFVFAVEANNEACDANEAGGNKIDLTVTFPGAGRIYSLSLHGDQAVHGSELQCHPEPSSLGNEQLEGIAFAHGLRVYYTSQLLGISRNGDSWYFRPWKEFNFRLQPGAEPDVTLLEIIGPTLLVIVSEEIMYFVEVSLFACSPAAEKEDSVNLQDPGLTLDIIRIINLRLCNILKQIKHLHLDFSNGVPYIWLEANRIKLTDEGAVVIDEHPCSFDLYRLDFY
ncbi:unnamed protein product [Allacma fusca]|uniref:Uncharacterized protein n=1 Tax=Allacma fusca TaxID=39272 RepID=A0A8J2L9F4_9HEXA|nr:unnamed protein product [Allacma fusca]